MQRFDYFIRRLLLIIPTFLGITLLVFALIQFVPGGPVEQAMLQMRGIGSGEGGAIAADGGAISPEMRRQLEAYYGFDQPFFKRYSTWLVTHRMGLTMPSYRFPDRTAWQLIRRRFPVSLIFGLTGFFLSYLVCIPLGIAKALRHGSRFDIISSLIVFTGYAIPVVAFGMLLKLFFTGTVDAFWDILPLGGLQSEHYYTLSTIGRILDRAKHMLLPVLCYVIGNFAVLTLLMKNSLFDQISSDYVRTVLAKGGSFKRAVWRHALRNALIPIATGFGGILTVMFAGSVIIEQIFEIPGMGRLSLESIVTRDYPVFMATLTLTAILGMLGNILSDLAYLLIDPRITFMKSQ